MAKYISDFRRGDTRTFQVKTSQDYTGSTLYFTMNDAKDETTPIAAVSSVIGTHAADTFDGTYYIANVTLDSTSSEAITEGKYYYSLRIVSADATPIVTTVYPPVADEKDKVTVGYRLKEV